MTLVNFNAEIVWYVYYFWCYFRRFCQLNACLRNLTECATLRWNCTSNFFSLITSSEISTIHRREGQLFHCVVWCKQRFRYYSIILSFIIYASLVSTRERKKYERCRILAKGLVVTLKIFVVVAIFVTYWYIHNVIKSYK